MKVLLVCIACIFVLLGCTADYHDRQVGTLNGKPIYCSVHVNEDAAGNAKIKGLTCIDGSDPLSTAP